MPPPPRHGSPLTFSVLRDTSPEFYSEIDAALVHPIPYFDLQDNSLLYREVNPARVTGGPDFPSEPGSGCFLVLGLRLIFPPSSESHSPTGRSPVSSLTKSSLI